MDVAVVAVSRVVNDTRSVETNQRSLAPCYHAAAAVAYLHARADNN